ncbi:MAG TPA: AMP-binding protein [Candidatus Binatia bacterium]|jgi:non-ribosomal peptide synthetase component E (peptide arylation enzyme)
MPATSSKTLRAAIARIMPLMTAADFCDRNAREKADQEALVDGRHRYSWSQVKILSDRLAAGLKRSGLERDAHVLVQLPNQAELFITRLACEKAGLRLITAAPAFRRAELEPIVRLTRPQAAIISRRYRGFDHFDLMEQIGGETLRRILVVGDDVPAGTLSLDEIFSQQTRPKELQDLQQSRYSIVDVCQIATTSGSTGIPKCVEVPLYTRLLTGWIHVKRFGVAPGDTLAAATPIITGTADALVYNGGCATGARIVLLDHFAAKDACAVLEAEGVNVVPLVPTMMVRITSLSNLERYDLRSLRVVVSHGAPLPEKQGEDFEKALGCRVVQAFGSVDCGGISATNWTDSQEVRLGTVGKPLNGNEIKIVDAAGQGVSQGERGRLLVRGLHTDARFFANPALNQARRAEGHFDLQEIAQLDADGNIILAGREQELIIRGGQNIYPADVEAILSEHPSVLEVAVVGAPDEEMGERVWAFVVCRSEKSLSLEEVRTFLAQKGAARFKWPEALQLMESLPKVAAGHKVDRRSLREATKF